MRKGFCRTFNDGKRGARPGIAFVPVLQADKHAGNVLPVSARAGTDGGEDRDNVIFLFGEEVLLHFLHHFKRLLLRCAARKLHRGGEHPPVFHRQERGGQVQEQPHHPAQQHNVNHHPAQAAVQYATNGRFIARGVAVEHPVKPAEEPFLPVMLPFVQRFQNGGAQRGGEDQRDQHGEHHRRDDGDRELAINRPGGAAKEGHRDKDSRQYHRDTD